MAGLPEFNQSIFHAIASFAVRLGISQTEANNFEPCAQPQILFGESKGRPYLKINAANEQDACNIARFFADILFESGLKTNVTNGFIFLDKQALSTASDKIIAHMSDILQSQGFEEFKQVFDKMALREKQFSEKGKYTCSIKPSFEVINGKCTLGYEMQTDSPVFKGFEKMRKSGVTKLEIRHTQLVSIEGKGEKGIHEMSELIGKDREIDGRFRDDPNSFVGRIGLAKGAVPQVGD